MYLAKPRIRIPTQLRRDLLVECGHKCSIHNCREMNNLEAHHINSNPSDNKLENIIMICPTHHSMCERGTIDRKACKQYKAMLKTQPLDKAELILENIELIKNDLSQIKQSKKSTNNTQRRRKR